MKGWQLQDILDVPGEHCEYCGARLRWWYVLTLEDATVRVGSECVKSFIDDADPATAFRFFFSKWSQRRTYYWKKFAGLTWVMGQQKSGVWYVGATLSLSTFPWLFLGPVFETDEEARQYLAGRLLVSSWPGTKLREVRQLQLGE